MAVENVITSSSVGVDGNSYTSSVSNDQLTNDDFLQLMLEEMKQQDPTKPMDSAALMDSQLQMSTIQSNQDMATAMTAMQASYASSALSTASNMIGRNVEDGSQNDTGEDKSFYVETVENRDGELYLNVKESIGFKDALMTVDGDDKTYVDYDENGFILIDGEKIDSNLRVSLTSDGRFEYNTDGSLKLLDTDSKVIALSDENTDDENNAITAIIDKYKYASTFPLYSETTFSLPLNSVTKVS